MRQVGDSHFPGLGNIRLHAFIVDHKARPESTREATHVAKLLNDNFGPPPHMTASHGLC